MYCYSPPVPGETEAPAFYCMVIGNNHYREIKSGCCFHTQVAFELASLGTVAITKAPAALAWHILGIRCNRGMRSTTATEAHLSG